MVQGDNEWTQFGVFGVQHATSMHTSPCYYLEDGKLEDDKTGASGLTLDEQIK